MQSVNALSQNRADQKNSSKSYADAAAADNARKAVHILLLLMASETKTE